MTRSRLDEIVEEELRPQVFGTFDFTETCRRIAERSFRHGVERAHHTNWEHSLEYKGIPWIWDVQPATAEEKCCNLVTPHFHGNVGVVTLDRRKGQRRKGQEEIRWVEGPTIGWYGEVWVGKGYSDIGPNRRSGQDRRKP